MEENRSTPPDVNVHIWKTSPRTGNIGHAGIQVGNKYVSIWPGRIPAVGPLAIVPLSAESPSSLEDDMKREAQHLADLPNNRDEHGIPDLEFSPEYVSPDLSIKVDGLNTQAMDHKIDEIKTQIARTERRYQLFPIINLFKFITDAPAYLSYDEVDIQKQRQLSQSEELFYKPSNCTTVVAEVLRAGGLPIEEKNLMGVTPNSLAKQVQRHEESIRSNQLFKEARTNQTIITSSNDLTKQLQKHVRIE